MKKVDEKMIQQVLHDHAAGEKTTEICRKYGVAKSSIYRWLNSRTEREPKSITKLSPREFSLMQVELERLRIDCQIFSRCACSRMSPIAEKLSEMEHLHHEFSVHALCRVLDVRRSTFYHYLYRKPVKTQIELQDEALRPRIMAHFMDSKERFGAMKIRALLIAEGFTVSRGRITRLMKEMELVCKQSRLRYWSTTARKYKYYKNKLQQDFKQEAPNLVWASDITYIRVKADFHYVCVVIDLFSRNVLAYKVSDKINTPLVRSAFDAAFEKRNRPVGLKFHNDQGLQYTSYNFRKHLRDLGVSQSFSNPGTPLDNAVVESFFSCMKREELSHNLYETREQLEADVAEFVDYYNRKRPHQKLGFRTPLQVEADFANGKLSD